VPRGCCGDSLQEKTLRRPQTPLAWRARPPGGPASKNCSNFTSDSSAGRICVHMREPAEVKLYFVAWGDVLFTYCGLMQFKSGAPRLGPLAPLVRGGCRPQLLLYMVSPPSPTSSNFAFSNSRRSVSTERHTSLNQTRVTGRRHWPEVPSCRHRCWPEHQPRRLCLHRELFPRCRCLPLQPAAGFSHRSSCVMAASFSMVESTN
jgi:hypothetical protein